MADKVYKMKDSYDRRMADLLEFIKLRGDIAESLKVAPLEKLKEGREVLLTMDKKIEEREAALATEYEAYQLCCRLQELSDKMLDSLLERSMMFYIHLKYNHPEKVEEFETLVFENHTPEEEQNFYDQVAILEATRLREIVARVGDTEADIDRKIKEKNERDKEKLQ